jgi:LmbE family N-acetylglucosaminyl deacetylase
MYNPMGISSILSQYVDPSKAPGAYFDKVISQQERAQERADKLALEAKRDAQWDKSFSLQKAAADMQAEKFGIDKATTQGNILANKDLQNATQGLITPEQADTILAAYSKNPKADVVAMQNAAKAQYEASPILQRQYISGVSIDQGPQEVVVGMNADGTPITKAVQGDVSVAQELKNKMLGGYDTRIAADKLAAAQKAEFDARMGIENQKLGLDKQRLAMSGKELAAKLAEIKTPKESEYSKAYSRGMGSGAAKWESMTPSERAKDKDARVASKLAAIQSKAGIFGNLVATDSGQYAEALKAVEDEDKAAAAAERKLLEAARKNK